MKLLFAIIAMCCMVGLLDQDAFSEVIWHHPPDKAIVRGGGRLHAILELQGEDPSSLTMHLNDVPIPPAKPPVRTPKGTFAHYYVQLESGPNTLEAIWRGGRETREAFFVIPWGKGRRAPAGFTPLVFHQAGKFENNCGSCHDLQPKLQDAAPPAPEQSTCYVCHAQITAFKQVHGPASRWACTFCHDPDSAPARYATPQPNVSELCFRCHNTLKEYFYKGPYQHGPTATGRCTICHNPHATDNPFWLKRPPWYLCTSCHTEKASGRHVIAWGPSGNTHPTRGKPDPMRPHMELACNSCHNPHAAPSPKLWQFRVTGRFQLCQTCHQK
ncbi:MAG: cytochrome c3 family protein [Dehalococcoidia bacterium]